jgi:hypothetical protein
LAILLIDVFFVLLQRKLHKHVTTENRSNVRGIFGAQEVAIQRRRHRHLRLGRDLQARRVLALSNVAQGRGQVRT